MELMVGNKREPNLQLKPFGNYRVSNIAQLFLNRLMEVQ